MIEQLLCCRQECGVDADQHRGPRTAGRANPEVTPSRPFFDRALHREEVVFHVQTVRWKHRNATHEDVVHLLLGFAHRCRRGDDLRLDRLAIKRPATQFIHGCLIQAHHGAQRPTDQVELILNDQVGWANRVDGLYLRGRKALARLVIAIAIGTLPKQAVAFAFLAHATKQCSHLSTPRHHGELVYGGDHHRGWAVVDLFVDYQHRNPRMRLLAGLALREVAAAFLVAAVDKGTARAFVDLHVSSGCHFRATPRATGELRGGCRSGIVFAGVAHILDGSVTVLGRPRRHLVANPEADGERFRAEGLVALFQRLAAQYFHGANQRCGTLELLQRQQAQGVAHDHGQAA